jgi:hypothetical protein
MLLLARESMWFAVTQAPNVARPVNNSDERMVTGNQGWVNLTQV